MMQAYGDAVLRVCFDREESTADLDLLGDHDRWRLYRRMVRGRIETLLYSALPRSLELLGREETAEQFAAWFAAARPRSRYFWHLPLEFGAFVTPRLPELPAHLVDLLLFELASWRVRQQESPPAPTAVDFDFERCPAIDPTVIVLAFGHPVHLLDETCATPSTTQLCLYRDPEGDLGLLTLNPVAASLLQSMLEYDRPLAETVRRVTRTHGVNIGPSFLDALGGFIATLFERGVLLGSLPD